MFWGSDSSTSGEQQRSAEQDDNRSRKKYSQSSHREAQNGKMRCGLRERKPFVRAFRPSKHLKRPQNVRKVRTKRHKYSPIHPKKFPKSASKAPKSFMFHGKCSRFSHLDATSLPKILITLQKVFPKSAPGNAST